MIGDVIPTPSDHCKWGNGNRQSAITYLQDLHFSVA